MAGMQKMTPPKNPQHPKNSWDDGHVTGDGIRTSQMQWSEATSASRTHSEPTWTTLEEKSIDRKNVGTRTGRVAGRSWEPNISQNIAQKNYLITHIQSSIGTRTGSFPNVPVWAPWYVAGVLG